ncbi:MAG: hypothetical protein WD381_06035 [Balneolaceae bacterium]
MKVRSLILVAFLLVPVFASAQDSGIAKTGSYYSSIGFGAPADSYSSYTLGIGLPGVSVYSPYAASTTNPAQWGLVDFTQGQITMGLTNFEASDNVSSAKNSLFAFENIQIVLPIKRNRLGASVSFTPVTRADYTRTEDGSIMPTDLFDEIEYRSVTTGTGGVNRLELGLGYKLNDNFSLGYAGSVYLLSMEENELIGFSNNQFNRPTAGSPPVDITNSITGSGVGNRFGFFSRFAGVLSSNDRLFLGSTVTLPVNIDGDRSVETFRTVNNQSTRVELNENSESRGGNITLPLEFNAGLTYYLNSAHSITTELQFQNWNDAAYSYNESQQQYFTDRTKFGMGYEYHPYLREQNQQGFFSNFKYSLGATFDDGFLSIDDQDIETMMLHAGISIPGRRTQRSWPSVDLSFNYGIRGTESNNLVKENIWGFKLSLNLAELMFLQQRFQ